MKKNSLVLSLLAILGLSTGVVASDVPVVSNVQLEQRGRRLYVTYDLVEAPAVVTMDILTNGVSIGEAAQAFYRGAVNRHVSVGRGHLITVRLLDVLPPGLDFPDTTVKVKAWNVIAPPDYLVASLVDPGKIRYYVSTNALPHGGLTNDIYRTDLLVMRRIPAAGVRWMMGEAPQAAEASASAIQHPVVLSEDFYMGVFEITQHQQELMTGTACDNNEETGYADSPLLPAHAKRRNLRPYKTWWKADGHEFSDGHIAKFRARTGLAFDLPTEAQWEYACRAGSPYELNVGTVRRTTNNWNTAAFEEALARCAWYSKNSDGRAHRVGEKEPNAFGLYDMHGNLAEWVLDYLGDPAVYDCDRELDPPGAQTAKLRNGSADDPYFPARGGSVGYPYYGYEIRSASREERSASWTSDHNGYRLVAPVRAEPCAN